MRYLPVCPDLPLHYNVHRTLQPVIARLSPRDHVTSILRELHWLPVPYRITYKLCLLMHLIHTGQAPSYLTDIVTQTATVSSRSRLRSASSLRYEQPRTRLKLGQRAFFYAAPAAWNTLPTSLQQISDTETFKRHLTLSERTRTYPTVSVMTKLEFYNGDLCSFISPTTKSPLQS